MADQHRRRKSDDDSEKSFSESDVEIEDTNEAQNNPEVAPEKEDTCTKVAEGSEYESAEEQEDKEIIENEKISIIQDEVDEEVEVVTAEKCKEESCNVLEVEEPLSDVVDEEGGKEGTAEIEDVEGDFLSGDANDEEEEDVSEVEDGEDVEEERQQGDGEECSPDNTGTEKELDFDEDRRNPQYIPKKGVFYEHDDRNNEDIKEKEEEPTRDRKKKLWLDEGKWGHDRFHEEEQYPKSRNELIDAYGYDIRNEDGPPRARRRRRYGRGPTKYDRNWEDVTAYGREKFRAAPRALTRGRRGVGRFRGGPGFRGRGHGQFDSENPDENRDVVANNEVPDVKEIEVTDTTETTPIINNAEFPALPTKPSEPKDEVVPEQAYFNKNASNESKSVRTLMFENSTYSNRNSVERDAPPPPRRGKTLPFGNNHERGMRRGSNPRGTRGYGRGEFNKRGRGTRHISPRFLENKVNKLSSDLENLSLNAGDACNEESSEAVQHGESNGVHPDNNNELLSMALKGAGDSSGRPKRYSSLRQRSLPESSTYQAPQQQHPSYYETGYQSGIYAPADTTPSTQSQTVSSTPILNPSAYQAFTPPPYTDNYGIRMPVTTPPPSLFPQVSVPGPQPMLPPPPCITPAPNMMGFAPPPPAAGYHQFAYQRYATPPPPPIPPAVQPPPSDMYQV